MPNQLTLSYKTTSPIPLRSALREYIQSAHSETHPDAFKWDLTRWEGMRKEAVGNIVHIDVARKIIAYHAQLVFILTKLPVDIGLPIPYTRAFAPNSPPLTLTNLAYERANILYNLAALYCQLATSEDRSSGDGIKRAVAYFQNAAGVLSHLISTALPCLETSLPPNTTLPADLSEPFLKALQRLMLSQAQECFWQRAVVDNMKNILIARLSSKTSSLYQEALDAMEIDPATSTLFPLEWIPHVRTKYHHFAAAALYRKSLDDLEANRYGEELARLGMAQTEAKKAVDAARKGGVARTVQDDIKSLHQTLEASFLRAERDNDLIYHQDVPSPSAVPPIPATKDMVMDVIPPGLKDPKIMVKEGEAILGELNGWGVKVAIDIYKEKKQDWLQSEVVDRAKQLDAAATLTLQSLNLPAALDALDRPIGLPPSLLGKAEEVRLEDGVRRIPTLIDDVKRLAGRDSAALDEALDILDQEATEDEEMRTAFSVDVWTRPASHEANQELTDQARRYREVLERAAESDKLVRNKWDEWAERIDVLCWDESDIERAVPSSTVSSLNGGGSKSTQGHARALRSHLESLDDLLRARTELVQRVQRLASSDDVAPRLMREAAAIARWVEVRPEMFDEVIEEELGKYERFREELEEGERRQEEALAGIKDRNALFLDSRREDPSVKVREHALQSLDLAYHKYREIHKNLTEGIKFYNDFAAILGQFKENCKTWVLHRQKDVEWLTESLNAMSVAPPEEVTSPSVSTPLLGQEPRRSVYKSAAHEQPMSSSRPPAPDFASDLPPPDSEARESNTSPVSPSERPVSDDFAMDLPPPDSEAWETMAIPAALPKAPVKHARKTRASTRHPAF